MRVYPFDKIDLDSFIEGYEKKESDIIVKTSRNKKYRVFRTKENEEKILKTMEEQMNLLKPNDYIEKGVVAESLIHKTVPFACVFGAASVLFFSRSGADTAYYIERVLFYIETAFFVPSAMYHYIVKYFTKEYGKTNIFLDNKKRLNSFIKKHPECLDVLKSKAKSEIEDNMVDKNEEPININTLRLIRLKQLKKLVEKTKFYEKYDFEDADDVIDRLDTNQVKDLIEKYDKPKKKKELIMLRDE